MIASGKIRSSVIGAMAFAAFASLALACPATAQQMTQARAAEQLTALRVWNAQLLEKSPALVDVEAAVTGDCRSRRGEAEFVNYCSCARSIVMYLWMNAGDDRMKARVESYAADPSTLTPADFLQYQGPELYKPFCDLALGTT